MQETKQIEQPNIISAAMVPGHQSIRICAPKDLSKLLMDILKIIREGGIHNTKYTVTVPEDPTTNPVTTWIFANTDGLIGYKIVNILRRHRGCGPVPVNRLDVYAAWVKAQKSADKKARTQAAARLLHHMNSLLLEELNLAADRLSPSKK